MVKEVSMAVAAHELAAAAEAKKPWFELTRMIEAALAAMPAKERSAARETLARSAGIAPAVANRYVRLLSRMGDISREMKVTEDELLVRSFNSQEIAARIYSHDRVEGADVLRRLALGEIALPRLREAQARVLASPDVSLRTAIAHTRTSSTRVVESALRNDGAQFFGEGFRTRRRPKLRFVGNTGGYEAIGADGSIAAGIDVIFPDDRLGHDVLDRNLGRSLLLAQFFRKFYLAFPSSAEVDIPVTRVGRSSSKGGSDHDMVTRTIELLDWLKYDWVGVLIAVDENTLKELRPSEGPPVPDMSGRYESYIRIYTSWPADNPFRRKD
jgi:hypothetical protein